MSEFTFLEVHFHEFNPTNTAPLLGRGGSTHGVSHGESTPDADVDLDDSPAEDADESTQTEDADDSGGVGGLLMALVVLLVVAAVARKRMGGDDELSELESLETVE